MASRRRERGIKRKSKDFIYEINENDLSADDDEENAPTKTQKIDSDIGDSSRTLLSNLEIKSNIEKNEESTKENSENTVKTTATNEVNASDNPDKITDLQIDRIQAVDNMNIEESCRIEHNCLSNENMRPKHDRDVSIIEVGDSDVDLNCSVEILEKTVPLVELSDDEVEKGSVEEIHEIAEEEGEISEIFEVVDEVGPTPSRGGEEDENFIINISFMSEEVKKCYESKVLKFLETFPEFDISSSELCINVGRKLDVPDVPSNIPDQKTPRKKHKKKKAKKELFILDTNPSVNDSHVGVRYASKFTIEEEKPEDPSLTKRAPSAQTCFNCGKSHALKDCTVPKDYQKINASRQKFMNNKNKSTRYHEEEDQKYAHLKPGVISENLRNALGLRKNELPSYIYGMRVLGYPPGWLEEAKFVHSSLRMFDGEGGKVKENKGKRKTGLDPNKIVDYPGFNVPMQKGFHDDFRKYNVVQYSKNLGKELMLKHYENVCVEETDSDTSDMDLDESSGTMKKSLLQKFCAKESASCSSPSLTDLEKQKKELLDQLNASNLNNSLQNSTLNESNNVSKDEKVDTSNTLEAVQPVIAVKSSALGTPILKSNSPFSRLPNPENFMVGVSPVIDFENLPNSTGKYENLSGVLNKVRSTLKNLEGCKS